MSRSHDSEKPRILLIVPPVEEQYVSIITNTPLLTSIRKYPALGLGYVASMLEEKGYHVVYLDMFAMNMHYHEFRQFYQGNPVNLIGITTDMSSLVPAKKIASIVHEINDGSKVIIGGINMEIYPEDIMAFPGFDIGVIGEGEYTIIRLLDALEKQEDLYGVDSIVFKEDGKTIITSPRDYIRDLDELPFPARHLMPINHYVSNTSKRNVITTMITSRGCPFNCLYCVKESPYRKRSVANVCDEIEHIRYTLGIKEIMFVDSTFSVSVPRAIEICKEIMLRDIDITWEASTRVDCVSKELFHWMRAAGCVRIQFGVESGDERVLKILRKGITLSQARNAVAWAKKAGLEILINYMIGCPGDTLASIQKTINLAIALDSDFAVFTIATAGPGTDMMDIAMEQGLASPEVITDFIRGKIKYIPRIIFTTKEYDRKKLDELLSEAYRRFYFRPRYFLKRLKRIRSLSELWNHILGFKNVLKEVLRKVK
ncbi:radical SAM protein [Candidatus Bathyarchaeota archaeon]|nr:radical SAM protein [Candidatus Bathyarchaeota archaeon]